MPQRIVKRCVLKSTLSVGTSWESANGIEFFQTDPAAWVWARQPIDLRVETAFSRLNANPSASGHRNSSDIRCYVLEGWSEGEGYIRSASGRRSISNSFAPSETDSSKTLILGATPWPWASAIKIRRFGSMTHGCARSETVE